ncbi:hypothetical protein [Nonomuraea sp. NPDC023979]|uniref:hypothetical protein n=1 Tax=Nonomuraea sp. NPDC023979 TaxID=3154796 RepID=UPI0033F4ADF9
MIAHPLGHTTAGAALTVLGGPALFLARHAVFQRVVSGTLPTGRLIASALLVATAVAAHGFTPRTDPTPRTDSATRPGLCGPHGPNLPHGSGGRTGTAARTGSPGHFVSTRRGGADEPATRTAR